MCLLFDPMRLQIMMHCQPPREWPTMGLHPHDITHAALFLKFVVAQRLCTYEINERDKMTERDSQSKSFDRAAKVRARRGPLALRSAPGQELSLILRTTSRGHSTHSRCPKPRQCDSTFEGVGCQKAVRAAGFRPWQDLCFRLQATYEPAVR